MILNSHTELGLPVREVEGAVSFAEESCMLVGSRKPLFIFYNGREPAHRILSFLILILEERLLQ